MKVAVVAITARGRETAAEIAARIPGARHIQAVSGIKDCIEQLWSEYDGIICVMAAGIAVRCISALIDSKYKDPCVIVVDEQCVHAISLLSGHLGGGNRLTELVSSECGAEPIITTASDISGHTSVDLWAVENNFFIATKKNLARVSSRLLDRSFLNLFQEKNYLAAVPEDFRIVPNKESADIVVGEDILPEDEQLHLIPRINYIGFGCRAGVEKHEFEEVVRILAEESGINPMTIAGIASIDIKKDEKGMLEFSREKKWPIRFFSKEKIRTVYNEELEISSRVEEKIGVYGVCEPAALLAAENRGIPGKLIVKKRKWKRITAAIAARELSTL